MRSNWRKTIAGIVAIAALIPCCLGTTAYAAPQSAADTVISAVMPELEEPILGDGKEPCRENELLLQNTWGAIATLNLL